MRVKRLRLPVTSYSQQLLGLGLRHLYKGCLIEISLAESEVDLKVTILTNIPGQGSKMAVVKWHS